MVTRATHLHVLFNTVRQLEQRVKAILDSIAVSDDRKRELIRGDAVDKAEQLSMFALANNQTVHTIVKGTHAFDFDDLYHLRTKNGLT